ncbi:hypothetical protein ATCC90586_010789 [Pythium insidiosum]|nr:hypothetical protein ATCC90586_010789 [Pythium insidiosum]
MKAPTTTILALLVSTIASSAFDAAQASPMHAGIDYHRYLEEKETIGAELDAWMNKYKDVAEKNGWMPSTESRSAEEVDEDRKQRFFMSKQLVADLKNANPDAQFSTDSPFSLLTTQEFAEYIKNSPSQR